MMMTQLLTLKTGKRIKVRDGVQADVHQIWELFNLVVRENQYLPTIYPIYSPHERTNWLYEMQRPENLLLVAEDDNRVVAYLTLEQCGEDATNHVCSLGILVHPFYRKQGLGRWLIELAQKQAVIMKYEKIVLSVFHTNIMAINTYKKLGFIEVGRRRKQFKIKKKYVDEILMDYFVTI